MHSETIRYSYIYIHLCPTKVLHDNYVSITVRCSAILLIVSHFLCTPIISGVCRLMSARPPCYFFARNWLDSAHTHRPQTSAEASNPQLKVIRHSNPDFRINPDSDPDVCRIAPKMSWIHYLVGVNHFVKSRENRPVTVWEMPINPLKSPIPQLRGK